MSGERCSLPPLFFAAGHVCWYLQWRQSGIRIPVAETCRFQEKQAWQKAVRRRTKNQSLWRILRKAQLWSTNFKVKPLEAENEEKPPKKTHEEKRYAGSATLAARKTKAKPAVVRLKPGQAARAAAPVDYTEVRMVDTFVWSQPTRFPQ